MAHILETLRDGGLQQAISTLEKAHREIVSSCTKAQSEIEHLGELWGIGLKRLEVRLPNIPGIIGKESEKLVELINILATVERTISALKWFASEFPETVLRECHPSTSDDPGGNDIVLVDASGAVVVRCEVCDVASSSAGQNGKEKKDIRNLGCSEAVPIDGIRRFIATSLEFSLALTSSKRKWHLLPYEYVAFCTENLDGTVMLEVIPSGG